ncbi:hypothetical protein TcasGA2_TC033907, partial [Tribolium castaneum]
KTEVEVCDQEGVVTRDSIVQTIELRDRSKQRVCSKEYSIVIGRKRKNKGKIRSFRYHL